MERQFYPTPQHLVEQLADLAGIEPGHHVLEPLAGTGAIARYLAELGAVVDCVEVDPGAAQGIQEAGWARNVITGDFLHRPRRADYDAVVMNPPFAKRQDLKHISHAEGFVRPGGRLVAVMSAGIAFWTDRAAAEFRQHVQEAGGTIEPLPDDTFHSVGIKMRTVVVVIPAAPVEVAPPPHRPAAPLSWSKLTPEHFARGATAARQDGLLLVDATDELGTPPLDGFGFGAVLHGSADKK